MGQANEHSGDQLGPVYQRRPVLPDEQTSDTDKYELRNCCGWIRWGVRTRLVVGRCQKVSIRFDDVRL